MNIFKIAGIIRLAILAAIIIGLASLAGCAAVLEHDARACHRAAMTVKAMQACSELHPQHNGTATDTLAQPLGTLERHMQHRNHDHKPEAVGWYDVEIDGRTVSIWASSKAEALERSRH